MLIEIECLSTHHPCVSDWICDSGMEICCFATPSLPCTGDEEGLFFLRDCRRDISRHLKAHGLSKCSEDICDEVDLLLCRGGELNVYIFFSSKNNRACRTRIKKVVRKWY